MFNFKFRKKYIPKRGEIVLLTALYPSERFGECIVTHDGTKNKRVIQLNTGNFWWITPGNFKFVRMATKLEYQKYIEFM